MNELLVWLARGTLHVTLVAALVLLVRALLLRRMPPRALSLLWMILLVRMVLPWAPGSAFSIHNLIGAPPGGTPSAGPVFPLLAGTLPEAILSHPGDGNRSAADLGPRGNGGASSSGTTWGSLVALLPAVWLGGVLLLASLTIAINIVHWRRLCQASPVTDRAALLLLRQCRRKMGLVREPLLIETDYTHSPALFGLIRPRLLLPRGATASLSPSELRHVFKHELAHLKRHDILLSWLAAGLQIVHWFNPLIWFAFRRWRADRETMCDALALTHAPVGESHSYAVTLVSLAAQRSGPGFVPSLTSLFGRKAELKRRISMIHKCDMLKRRTPWLAIGVIAVVAFISLTNAKATRAGKLDAVEGTAGWRAADGTRPAYVPETSWLDENGRIVDKIDYPFVDDPAVLGVWTSVDFVQEIAEFDPVQPNWQGELYLQKLDFLAGGGTRVKASHDSGLRSGPWDWTKGLLMHGGGDHSAAAYEIRSINGVDYLFLEWKSGDYIIRHAKPAYYVFVWSAASEDVDAEPASDDDSREHAAVPIPLWTSEDTRPDYVPETSWLDEDGRIRDETDYAFVDDPAVLGEWASVDLVRDIDDFDPAERRWQGSFWLVGLEFGAQGRLGCRYGDDEEFGVSESATWTKGLLLQGDIAPAYVIQSFDGVDYLFLEWKSGDYTIRHTKPSYYVMRRAD